ADCILFDNRRPGLVKETASPYSAFEALFLSELDKLSEEDKQKALEHVRFLAYLAEQKQKNHDE
ncbi:MAG TPA: transcriptional regulator, partial [Brevibacillus sp.]|nr:transcriptional regulator [Brevibacillus sp.]